MDPTDDPKYSYDSPEVSYGPPQQMPSNYGQPPTQPMTTYGAPPVQSSASASNVTVVVSQPTAQSNQLMATSLDGSRTWTTGLFDCFSDITSCLFTCFCYNCAVCRIASRTGECFCAPVCVPGGHTNLRTRIRTVGGIRGSMCDDCMVIGCCGPCAACQEARELNNMGIPWAQSVLRLAERTFCRQIETYVFIVNRSEYMNIFIYIFCMLGIQFK